MHTAAPLADWYVPAAHGVQTLWAGVAVYVPGLHADAATLRSAQYDPAGQSMHAVPPLADWYLPALQAAQAPLRVLAEMAPGSHAV